MRAALALVVVVAFGIALLFGAARLGIALREDGVPPETLKRVTFEDLVEAGGESRMDIFVVTPGTTMRLDCVRIGDAAGDSPAAGEGLSYCKWRRALNSDLTEYTATYGSGPVG